jgi:transcriptional regulator with XRE-family HTH domain
MLPPDVPEITPGKVGDMSTEEKFRKPLQQDPEDVKAFVAFLRLLRGWTQAELAEALELTAGAISRYETGDVVPDRETLEDVALAVGLPLPMLDRTFLCISAARAAVASALEPADRDRRYSAITRDLAAGLFDLACLAAATVLAELPDLSFGPWADPSPFTDSEDSEEPAPEEEGD